MKRTFLSVFLMILLIPVLAVSTLAAEVTEEASPQTEATEILDEETAIPAGRCGDDLSWQLVDGTLTISGTGPMEDCTGGAVWQYYKEEIRAVVLTGGVTTVGAEAFRDYDNIKQVDFGTALTQIDKGAFQGCDGLTEISLPASFKIFGEDCFRDCAGLTKIHCAGGFPSFRLNCLWNAYLQILYPAERPWPVALVEELETAFQGRIEFLASDGSDPYTPTEPTAATEAATAPTAAPTEATQATKPTEAPAQPTEAATEPETTALPETTEKPTVPTTAPTQPAREEKAGSGVTVILALAGMVLSGLAIAALVIRSALNRRGRFSEYDDE